MHAAQKMQNLIDQKLEAFEQLYPEFETSFQFKQDVHGQKRFLAFPVAYTVRYLHALWVCECKDGLLSSYNNIARYEGWRCLEVLQSWQEGNTSTVIAFLHHKLDMLPLVGITHQIQEAQNNHKNDGLRERLIHGRLVMLNRGMNLLQAFDAIFALSDDELLAQVKAACSQYNHEPSQIEQQLGQMETPLFSYIPHQLLAQRNMLVMNKLGVNVLNNPTDQPGNRSWKVVAPTEPMSPFAEHIIQGYQERVSPIHNNIKDQRFIDHHKCSDITQF